MLRIDTDRNHGRKYATLILSRETTNSLGRETLTVAVYEVGNLPDRARAACKILVAITQHLFAE